MSRTGEHGEQYVAWAWAVNGFFSVIGSVLTTILAMELGFSRVQLLALAVYVVAALAYAALRRAIPVGLGGEEGDSLGDDAETGEPELLAPV